MSEETASLSTMAQDVGSSMSYMWIQAGRLDLFIIAPFCFSALQDSWSERRLLAGGSTSTSQSGEGGGGGTLRLQHICVCSHQCVIVQYDGRLMLKQD